MRSYLAYSWRKEKTPVVVLLGAKLTVGGFALFPTRRSFPYVRVFARVSGVLREVIPPGATAQIPVRLDPPQPSREPDPRARATRAATRGRRWRPRCGPHALPSATPRAPALV